LGGISGEFSSIPVTRGRHPDNEQKNRDAQFAPKVQWGGCRPPTTVMNARCESWRICDYGKLIEFFLFGTPKPEVAAFEDRWHRVADGQRGGRGAARGNGGR
jgi:hypothetical protein